MDLSGKRKTTLARDLPRLFPMVPYRYRLLPLLLLLKLPDRFDVLGLLDDLVDGDEPSFLRTLPELEVDQLPVLDLLELELLLEPVLPEPLEPALPAADEELPDGTEPLDVNEPVRSLVVGFFSSVDEEEDDEVELLLGTEVEYPL